MGVTQTADLNPAAAAAEAPEHRLDDPLLDCLVILTRLHGRPLSAPALAAGMPLERHRFTPTLLVRAAEQHGFSARIVKRPLPHISPLVLPAVLLLKNGDACVLNGLHDGGLAEVIFPETGIGARTLPLNELRTDYGGYCIFVQPRPKPDGRGGDEAPAAPRSWLWGTLWRFRRYYLESMVAALLVSMLTLATSLFTMNVYDRVVPNNAIPTLVVLAVGTAMAISFEFLARTLRGYFLDFAGKKADVLLAGYLFQQAMGLRMEARPASAGAFASQLREFESLRDFFTSATLATLTDLPFVFFFIWVVSLIGGPLYVVPLLAIPVVVLAGLIAQAPLARIMRQHMYESNQRHGVLVEAVEGLETLKGLSAEGFMQRRWESYTALTGRSAAHSRLISTIVSNLTLLTQQMVTVGVVVWGVHLIGRGELTMGALIACVILSSRALGPLAQVSGLLARYQHVRAAYQMLNGLMQKPVERKPGTSFLHRPTLSGEIQLEKVSFAYPRSQRRALEEVGLHIRPGERVAILGRVGSGKSTLLRLLMGLYQPAEGAILFDGAHVEQIDPADLRRNIGYIAQDVKLFYGTLRENVTMASPLADDHAILEVARLSGLDRLIAAHPAGFDMPVGEGGDGLSGGQRQIVAIARALLSRPPILLMDEPTSHMDHSTEQAFIRSLNPFLEGRTVVLVTHKPSMLGLVQRLIVMEGGKVVMDGPKDGVLKALAAPPQTVESARQGAAAS